MEAPHSGARPEFPAAASELTPEGSYRITATVTENVDLAATSERGEGMGVEFSDNPIMQDLPEQARRAFQAVSDAVVNFSHLIENVATGDLKEKGQRGLDELRRIAFGEHLGNEHPPVSMPDGSANNFKAGAQSPEEAAQLLASACVGAIKVIDQIGEQLTPGGFSQANHEVAEAARNALGRAAEYYSQKAEDNELGSIRADVQKATEQGAEDLVRWSVERNHMDAAERGEMPGMAAGAVVFLAATKELLTEKEFAARNGMTEAEVQSLPKEEFTKYGATKIEPVNGKLPRNCDYAGKVYSFDGALAEKYPEGVKFKETGYPDFSPYAIDEVQIELTASQRLDFKEANKLTGWGKTPDGYTWHHHEDGKTLQLVPQDLHGSVPHTGGVATSGLPYKEHK